MNVIQMRSGIAALLLMVSAASFADEPKKTPAPSVKPAASLDDDLLKELGEDPTKAKKPMPPAGAAPGGKPTGNSLDDELLKGLGEQPKSTGADDESNPIAAVTKKMRQVQQLMEHAKSDTQTRQLQEEIVKRLDELIKQQQQQQQKPSSSSSSNQPQDQQAQERQKMEQSQQAGGQKPNDSPAKDSSEQLRNRKNEKVDMANMQQMLKDVWGQLPPRLREQMLQSGVEQFLPKYELLIEEYFKTLAEQGKK